MSFVIDASIVVGFAFGEAPNPKIALAIDELAVSEALTAPRISSAVWRGCPSALRRRLMTTR